MAEAPGPDPAVASYHRAAALLDGMMAGGLTDVVISPGSRSTPLALAAARGGGLRVHVVADERAAAFFALGIARGSARPVLVLGTSGSAPAHWLPAAVEAAEDRVPLLLASADRPRELIGCGANQATDQSRLFGAHARQVFALPADASTGHAVDVGRRASLLSRWPEPGPVHVNVAFREPMVPEDESACLPWKAGIPAVEAPPMGDPSPETTNRILSRVSGRRGAILAGRLPPGSGAGPAAVALARAIDCPIIADPLSGLRAGADGGARVLVHADAFLRSPRTPSPEWLIRIGAPPVSRYVETWAAACPYTVLVSEFARWADPCRAAAEIVLAEPARLLEDVTGEAVRSGVRAARWEVLDDLEARHSEALAEAGDMLPAEAHLMAALARCLPEGTPLFLGNSLAVRDADSFLPRRNEDLRIFASRGVSGIDGNLATAAGLVAAASRPGVAVIGDLTLFHDLNSLSLVRDVPLVVVVVNNGGGAIFGQLAQARLPEFESLWLTPPNLDIGAAARLFGLDFGRLDPGRDMAADIGDALSAGRPTVLELVVDREASRRAREAWWRTDD
ncbi:MAG: 2-succinyl-5-enolpyruvyl-6-hydroxy-3-cyclohexene-1-carboxylic-acid synthase [Gammaproteobacteria bacterium]